jgi:hypothetical protein
MKIKKPASLYRDEASLRGTTLLGVKRPLNLKHMIMLYPCNGGYPSNPTAISGRMLRGEFTFVLRPFTVYKPLSI